MKKRTAFLILLFFSTLNCLQLNFISLPSVLEPNKSVTITIGIENDSDSLIVLNGELKTPDDWQAFLTKHQIQLKPADKTFKLSTVRIPLSAKAGKFSISYLITDQHKTKIDSISTFVHIPEIKEIELIETKLPEYSLSGDSLHFELFIKNKSNMPIQVKSDLPRNLPLSPAKSLNEEIAINQEKTISYFAHINRDIEKSQALHINQPFEIRYANGDKEYREVSYRTQIIPIDYQAKDMYNNLNINFSSQSRYDENDLYTYYSINGNTYLDAMRKQSLQFNYSGNVQQSGIFTRKNRSSISWRTRNTLLSYGDTNLSFVSPKIPSLSGRGPVFALYSRYINLNAGTVQDLDRFTNHYAFASSFKAWKYTAHKVSHVFSDLDDNNYTALENQIRINNIINFETEIANNHNQKNKTNSYAYDISWQPNYKSIYFKSRYYYKPNDFASSNMRSTQFNNALRFPAFTRIISLYFDHDTDKLSNKYQKEEIRLAGETNINKNLRTQLELKQIDTDYENSKKEEKLINNNWYYDFDLGKLKTYHSASFRISQTDKDSKRLSQSYRSSLIYPITANQQFKSSFTLNNQNNSFSNRNVKSLNSNLTLTSTVSSKVNSSLSYSNNLFLHKQTNMTHSISSNIGYIYAENWFFSFRTGISQRQKHSYWFTGLGLNYQLSLPLQERKDITNLKGRIIDQNNAAVEKKIIKLNQNLAISNQEGEFIFPALSNGIYTLDIVDKENYVLDPPLPRRLLIKTDSLQYINIKQTSASSIYGSVRTFKPVANWFLQDEPQFYDAGAYAGLTITLTDGNTTYSSTSDIRGNFSFKRLSSGTWTLTIDQNALPKNFQTEWSEQTIELGESQDYQINIKISEKLKNVIIKKI